MLDFVRDWSGYAMTVASFIYMLWPIFTRPRQRSRVSYRCLKLGSFEWTRIDREDDHQS